MTLPLIVALFACGSPTATTATTEAAEPDRPVLVDFDNPEACAPCHATVVAEWQESMHARAHHDNDPIYGHMKALRMKKQGEQIAGKCQQCHNPRAPAEPDSPAGRQGVSCATCHAATEVHRDRGPGAKALVFSDDTLRSARDVAPGASPVHGTGPAAPHLADGTTMCLACHDATKTPAGQAACTTGPEYERAEGAASCTSCHMPRTEGPSGAVSQRDHHASHTFAGPHRAWYQSDPSFLATAIDLSVTQSGTKVTATLVNQAAHAVPTGFPGRLMVVKLKGLDATGSEVWTNLTDDPMKQDPDAVLNKVYVDEAGNPTPAPFATKLARDTRLTPGETRTLSWTVPSEVTQVQAMVVMRLLPPPLAEKLGVAGQAEGEPRVIIKAATP